MRTKKQKVWAIFYKHDNKIYAVYTHLGALGFSDEVVNLFNNETLLKKYFNRAIKAVHTDTQDKETLDSYFKPGFRHGKVFIARLGSKHFPVRLKEMKTFHDGWALRVPFAA